MVLRMATESWGDLSATQELQKHFDYTEQTLQQGVLL